MTNLEIIIIGGIVILQIYIFLSARRKIGTYSTIIPNVSQLELLEQDINIPDSDLDETITLLDTKSVFGCFDEIRLSINKYLEKNKGSAANFSIIKDIVERSIDKEENEISLMTPIPLYLGLMGTLLGIIIGLWNIPSTSSSDFLEGRGVDILLSGVKIAMIASLCGLLLTTLNNGYFFRLAKAQLEQNKNDLYTFIQTSLLPILNSDVSSNLFTLGKNLNLFNAKFSKSVKDLESVMSTNSQALTDQKEILDKVQQLDVVKMSTANIDLFKEFKNSVGHFEKFQQYLNSTNSYLQSTIQLNERLSFLLERTEHVSDIVKGVSGNLEESKKMQQFLSSHFSELEARGQIIRGTVVKLEDQIDESLNHLERFINEKIESIKQLSIKEEDLLKSHLKEKSEVWNKLKELEKINTTNLLLNEIKEIQKKMIEELSNHSHQKNDVAKQRKNIVSKFRDGFRKLFVKR